MIFTIIYEKTVLKQDVPKLSPAVKAQILQAIEQKLTTQPEIFGKPLRYSLEGHRVLRSGNYRVIFRIEDSTVKVFSIRHRADSY